MRRSPRSSPSRNPAASSDAAPAPDRPLFDRDGSAMSVLTMRRLLATAATRTGLRTAEPAATGIDTADLRNLHMS